MQQIPRKYLRDAMTVRDPDIAANYEGEYLDPYAVKHIRYEPSEALNPAQYKLSDGAKGRIFIDAVNSVPAKAPQIGAKVSINDVLDMRVLTVTSLKGINRIHHWEVDVG
jgi:hypothetical protein